MIEIRWLRTPYTTAEHDRLQYRIHQPVVDIGGHLCPGDWDDEWKDVPVVVEPDPLADAAPVAPDREG